MKKNSINLQSVKKVVKNLLLMSMTVVTLSCATENENLDDSLPQEFSTIQYFDSKESFQAKIESLELTNDDNILSEVLNKDNIIGIGEYLIKIDIASESVYTLHKSHINDYSDLVNINLKNEAIMQLSVYDNVLGVLNGTAIAAKSSCGSPASYDYDYDSTSGNNRSLSLSARYRAYGIYFSLSYQCTPSDDGYSRLDEWDITYTTTSCVSYSSYGENDYGDGENEGSFSGLPYLGTTPLKSFHCFVVCSSSAGTVDVTIES